MTGLDIVSREKTSATSYMWRKHVSYIYKMVTATKSPVSEDIPENVISTREAFADEMETAVICTDLEKN